MGVPLRQSIKVGTYVARQKLARRDKFPLIVELEPLFNCNLECNGCGKIQYPTEILRKRLSVDQAVAAIEECGAPMVSIAGGEPLLHPDIEKMTEALLARKRFVYLCTNALLLERKLDRFKPHPAFSWVVHIDGLSVKSCTQLALQADGTSITTIEGLAAADGTLHPMQEMFREHHALQCGFCTPGMVMTAVDLVQSHPHGLTEKEIREGLEGNLCRCTGYHNIVKAIAAAHPLMHAEAAE